MVGALNFTFTGSPGLSSPGIAGEEAVTAETDCAVEVETIAKAQTTMGTMVNIELTFFRRRWSSLVIFINFSLWVFGDSVSLVYY
ncbi:MAG: hypothetical protein WAM04_19725 [Candidatus Sulfotelmatobacter sp.]